MNLIARVYDCPFVDLIVLDFEAIPAFPCGHPRTNENTYLYLRTGWKWCKRCRAARSRKSYHDLRRRQSGLA